MGFIDLEKEYDKVKEPLWQVLSDVVSKMLNGIKVMYVKSLVYVVVKRV